MKFCRSCSPRELDLIVAAMTLLLTLEALEGAQWEQGEHWEKSLCGLARWSFGEMSLNWCCVS